MRKLLIRICRSVLLIGGFAALSFVGVEGRALCQTPQAPTQPTTVILDAAQDARLTKSFRLEARSQTLASLLQQLGEKSDVHLRVEAEWIGELRVNAFTRPLPLHRLLQRLAQAHNLSWRKQLPAVVTTSGNPPADAQPEYILYESEINRRYVALLKRRSWEPLRKDLEQLRSYVALSQEELERLARNGDALAARFKEPRERASAALKTALSESDLETLIGSKQRNLTYTFDQLTPAAKTALTFFAQERWERSKQNLKIALAQGANVPPAAYEPPKMEEYRVMYSLEGQGTGANLMVMAKNSMSGFMSNGTFTIHEASSVWLPERRARTRAEVRAERRADVRHAPAPLAVATKYWPEALEAVAAKWNLNLFSEAVNDPKAGAYSFPIPLNFSTKNTIADGLEMMGSWGGRWWQASEDGDDIIFQTAGWYETHGRVLDEGLLKRLKQMREQKEPFSLEILAELANASEWTQQEAERRLAIEPILLRQSAEPLRFYRSLSGVDKQKLTANGLAYSALRDREQRRLFGEMLRAGNAAVTDPLQQETRLKLTVEQGWSHFTLSNADNASIHYGEWRVHALPASLLQTKAKSNKPN